MIRFIVIFCNFFVIFFFEQGVDSKKKKNLNPFKKNIYIYIYIFHWSFRRWKKILGFNNHLFSWSKKKENEFTVVKEDTNYKNDNKNNNKN